jgi:superfamily II DNA or RNA helicase
MPLQTSYTAPPHLALNSPRLRTRVSTRLYNELQRCKAFRFYVAFVNQEGVASLLQPLVEAQDKGVPGRILVSQYLNFTEPRALRSLLSFSNLNVRIAAHGSVHAKGYFFDLGESESLLIGSSNWTASALSTNTELNVFIEASKHDRLCLEIADEFESQFSVATPVDEEFLKAYEAIYKQAWAQQSTSLGKGAVQGISPPAITPNRMQRAALDSLARLRAHGERKAILVSATGTGKTFLSAFDVQAMGAKRMLFVVHRGNIARAAMKSFRRVFGKSRTFGLYSGGQRDADADFLFCTVQTLSRPEHLDRFDRNAFDYIVVDESHRAGADTYARFLEHFSPAFLLGMTATPERTDGQDIFRYFDHNVAYEIRLHQALEDEILCPFHYFGVTDLSVGGQSVDARSDFARLCAGERVDRIVEKAKLYSCDDGIVRGLIFCSRVEEARGLSAALNERGLRTLALDGDSDEDLREGSIRRLEAAAESPDRLDYLLTVDIFNEGVDIPLCNQVILLRPTDSAIVFVQQLGRGLRRVDNKEKYLTVIDFIGNYENNYLIPVALYGDRSYDKDRLRRLLVGGNDGLPGTSTINFDEISRNRIFESINTSNLDLLRDLRADFDALRNRIGRVPLMVDFLDHDSRDPGKYSKHGGSFYAFSRDQATEDVKEITLPCTKILEAYSRDAFNGKTLEEPLLLKRLISAGSVSLDTLATECEELTGRKSGEARWKAALRSLNMSFLREKVGGQLRPVAEVIGVGIAQEENGTVRRTGAFETLLADDTFAAYLTDLAEYSCQKYLADLNREQIVEGFVRYRKYRRQDVFRILGFPVNPVAQNVGGYLISDDKACCPLFVTYHKQEGIAATTQYEDAFVDRETMRYFTKSNRTLRSPDVEFFKSAGSHQRILLFVQKNNDEGIEFYYVGDVRPEPESFTEQRMKDGQTPVVQLTLSLDVPVEESLYNYITR